MRTICPYCKQEYSDTPDEYLETTVTCSVCNKNFVAKKAKFCSECGAISPGQAIVCAQCGKTFTKQNDRPIAQAGDNTFADSKSSVRISSAENLCGWTKVGVNACAVGGVIASMMVFSLPLGILFVGPVRVFHFFICVVCLLPLGIVFANGAYLFSMVKKSHRKIYWTPYRKFILTAFCVLCILFSILGCGATIIEIIIFGVNIKTIKNLLLSLLFAISMPWGAIKGWQLFNVRAEEDIDYEESKGDISNERLNIFLSLANGFGFGALLPFLGILFLIISGIFLAIYKAKGGTDYCKTIVLYILGVIIQIVAFCFAFCL